MKPEIFPRRGRGTFKLASPEAPILKLAATPWSQDMTPVDATTLTAGLRKTPSDLRAPAKEAVERLAKKKLPDQPEDALVEAAYATMVGIDALARAKPAHCEAFGSFWARRSASFALDVAVRTCSIGIETGDDKAWLAPWKPAGHTYESRYVNMAGNQIAFQAWHGVRLALAAADDGAYEEAKARAAEHRRKLDPAYRVLVSFAFATERAWAAEDAKDALARATFPKYATPLLATELDPKTAQRLVEALEDEHYIVPYLTTAVDIHGAGARGILGSLLKKKPRGVGDRRALEAALG